MVTPTINAVVMWSPSFARTVAFYRAIGLPLADERHDDGPMHAAAELGAVHVAIYDAGAEGAHRPPGHREPGGTLVGFVVESLDAALGAIVMMDGVTIVRSPEDMPWGRRAVVRDPDGRVVELTEETH